MSILAKILSWIKLVSRGILMLVVGVKRKTLGKQEIVHKMDIDGDGETDIEVKLH